MSRRTVTPSTRLGIEHRIVVYPDAPHSFFDRTMSEHAEACRDAWAQVLGFVDSLAR